jgi:hypothetical protein
VNGYAGEISPKIKKRFASLWTFDNYTDGVELNAWLRGPQKGEGIGKKVL